MDEEEVSKFNTFHIQEQYLCDTNCPWESKMKIARKVWGKKKFNKMALALNTFSNTSINQNNKNVSSVQLSSVTQSCPSLWDPKNRSMPGLPVHHQLPEFTQTHVHRVGDAIQPSHPLLSTSPPAPNPSQHQSLFQWINSAHEVAKVLEFQPQHHSLQRTHSGRWTPNSLVSVN